MINFTKVGNKITYYRKLNKMTQDDLAEMINVTRQALSKWELGISAPSIDSLFELCQIFKTDFTDLLCLDEEEDFIIDHNNIFLNRNRAFVVNKIINNEVAVDIVLIFDQLSMDERMLVLRAIKDQKLIVDIDRLMFKLTMLEQQFLFKKTVIKKEKNK